MSSSIIAGEISNFPYGASSFGAPILPGGIVPNPKPGAVTAGVYYVSGDFGSDSYDGQSPTTPFKYLDTAYGKCLGGINEIIYVLGGTAAVSYSSAIASAGSGLVWAKNYTHLIGLAAPVAVGQRARITNGASTILLTPLIDVTGSGCLFQNLEFFNGGAHATEAAVCVHVSGSRNAFINCQISGGGNATNAGNAAMRSLVIAGLGGENLFRGCYIGLDTVQRTAASSELEINGESPRNLFDHCQFASWTGATTPTFLLMAANGIDRWLTFRECIFFDSIIGGGTAMAQAFNINATQNGYVLMHNCLLYGMTAMETSNTNLVIGDNAYAAATTGKGLAITW